MMNPMNIKFSNKKSFLIFLLVFFIICYVFFYKITLNNEFFFNVNSVNSFRFRDLPTAERIENMGNALVIDAGTLFYQYDYFYIKSIKEGSLPLWNHMVFSGTAFMAANQPAVFYPLKLFYLVLPFPESYGFIIFLHVFLGGLFMYLFLGLFRLSFPARLLGSVTFTFSSFIVSWMEFEPFIESFVWYPLVFYFIEKLLRSDENRKKVLYSLICGVVLGVQLLAGHLQVSYYLLVGCGIYILVRLLMERKRFNVQTAFAIINLFFIGIMIGSVQILPSFELAGLSGRDFSYAETISGKAAPYEILKILNPFIFGSPINHTYFSPSDFTNSGPLYVGFFSIFLLLSSFFVDKKMRRRLAPFYVLALVSILVSFGTWFFSIFYFMLPGFKSFGYITRVLVIYVFSMSAIIAFGLDNLKRSSKPVSVLAKILAAGMIIATAVFILLKGPIINIGRNIILSPGYLGNLERSYSLSRLTDVYNNELTMLVVMVVFSAASYLLIRNIAKKSGKSILATLIVAFITIDLLAFGIDFNTSSEKDLIAEEYDYITFLKSDDSIYRVVRFGRSGLGFLEPNTLVVHGISDMQGYDSLNLKSYRDFLENIEKGIGKKEKYIVNLDNASSLSSPYLDFLNVKYIISADYIDNVPEGISLVHDKELKIYENEDVFPRFYLINDDDYFSPVDGFNFNNAEYTGSSLSFEVSSPEDGLLVTSEVYLRGWTAEVDGKEKMIDPCFGLFRCVGIEKGHHIIEFRYFPQPLKYGLIIASIGMLLVILELVYLMMMAKPSKKYKIKKS